MLPIDLDVIRLFVHLLAASVWVGGQLVLGALVPTLRGIDPDAPRKAARRFNQVAWPAFGVLVVSGVWNLFSVDLGSVDTSYNITLGVKLLLVAASGIAAFFHSTATSKVVLAIGGAVALLAGLAAMVLGISMVPR